MNETVWKHLFSFRIPRPRISAQTSALAFTHSSIDKIWQIFRVNVLQQLLLIPTAENMDLFLSLFIYPHLDYSPYSRKKKRRIQDKHTSQHLRVIVLRHLSSRFHELVSRIGLTQFDVLKIQDGASLSHSCRISSIFETLLGASLENCLKKSLIKDTVVSKEPVRCGHLPYFFRSGKSESLNVYGRVLNKKKITFLVYLW